MIPFALIIFALGWIDLPPVPAALPALDVRTLTRTELLERRRDGREARRRRRRLRDQRDDMPHRTNPHE